MMELLLPGLDGANPLAFLGALGALRLLDQLRPGATRLHWTLHGTWCPCLTVPRDVLASPEDDARPGRTDAESALIATLLRLIQARREDRIFELRWPDPDGKDRELRNLRAPPATWRRWALALRDGDRLSADFVAASAAEARRDNNGKLKPTVFDFTAGQQMFLDTAEALMREVVPADLDEALFGPWRKDRKVKVLSWDATDTRDYALRATDPSKGKYGVPGADALALWGLPFLPVVPTSLDNRTTAAGGRWKSEWFRWSLWTSPLPVDVVRTAVGVGSNEGLDARSAAARGFAVRFEAGIGRSDQGGYGSFSPPEVRG